VFGIKNDPSTCPLASLVIADDDSGCETILLCILPNSTGSSEIRLNVSSLTKCSTFTPSKKQNTVELGLSPLALK